MPRIAMLSPQQYALLQTLQAAPGRAATLVAALPPEAQSWSPAPGAWSAPQVITHLAADWGIAPEKAKGASPAKTAQVEEIVQRREAQITMPAWQGEPMVSAHIMDLYAYLSARAQGTQGPERPQP